MGARKGLGAAILLLVINGPKSALGATDTYNWTRFFAAKQIIVQGNIKCREDLAEPYSAVNAAGVVIIPTPFIEKAEASRELGFYELRLPGTAKDMQIHLHCRNAKDKVCVAQATTLRREHIIYNDRVGTFIVRPDLVTSISCREALSGEAAVSKTLTFLRERPEQAAQQFDLETTSNEAVGASIAAVGPVGALLTALAGGLAAAGPSEPPTNRVQVINVSPSRIRAGRLSAYAMSAFSGNLGLNIAPDRNVARALFWNPSAISGSFSNQVEVSGNNDGFYSVSASFPGTGRVGIGVGIHALFQDETRTGQLSMGDSIYDDFDVEEYASHAVAALELLRTQHTFLSIGIAAKWMEQSVEAPGTTATVDSNTGRLISWDRYKTTRRRGDVDLSASYQASSRLTLGAIVTSLMNTELVDSVGARAPQQMVGLGGRYDWNGIQLGTDLFYRDGLGVDAAVGVSVVPFNAALLQSGYDTTFGTAVWRLAYGWGFYTYSDSRDFSSTHTFGLNIRY